MTPTFAQDVRATLKTYAAFIPRPVLNIITDAADHIEALQREVAQLRELIETSNQEKQR